MKKSHIPFFAFLVLLIIMLFPFDFAVSVIPGWHTIILPPYFIWTCIIVIVLFIITIGYWYLSKRVDTINWILFAFHFILTIPTVIFLNFPSRFLNEQHLGYQEIMQSISLQIQLVYTVSVLFIIGQMFFVVYFVRTIKAKRINA